MLDTSALTVAPVSGSGLETAGGGGGAVETTLSGTDREATATLRTRRPLCASARITVVTLLEGVSTEAPWSPMATNVIAPSLKQKFITLFNPAQTPILYYRAPGPVAGSQRLIHPSIPIRTVLPQIHLKALLRPAQFPGVILAAEVIHVDVEETHAQIGVTEGHSAQVRDVADASVDPQSAQEGNRAHDHHPARRLHRADEEKQNYLIRVQDPQREQQTVDRA